jgi:Zn-finger nucleic acid-binding protein
LSLHSQKTCPRCDTPLTGEEAACPQCHRPLTGTKLASTPGDKPVCPICKLPIYEAALAGLPVLHCAECKGMGLKRESMMKLQPYGPKAVTIGAEERGYKRPQFFEPRQKPPFLICPFCKKKMKGTTLAKFSVDICEECAALWLEEGKVEFLNDIAGPYKWKVSK